jgi:hypothetical protein
MIETPKTWPEISEIEATKTPPMAAKEPFTPEVGISLSVDVDVLGIAEAIASSVSRGQNRSGFVKDLMEKSFYAADQKYNVMVFNMSQEYEDQFQGVQLYASTTYDTDIIYGIWLFESGDFTNKGDGGWINWAFRGWFDRDGSHVKFRQP